MLFTESAGLRPPEVEAGIVRSNRYRAGRDAFNWGIEEAVRSDLDGSFAPTRPRLDAAVGKHSPDDLRIDPHASDRAGHRLSERPSLGDREGQHTEWSNRNA